MNQTPNYQLNQWDAEDKVQRIDFNADNEKIDAALNAQAGTLASHTAKLAAHTAQLAKLGNCQIWISSYRGTGTCGPNHPTRFTFPKKPILAMISPVGTGAVQWMVPENGIFNTPATNILTWSGSTASWYVNSNSTTAGYQYNDSILTYLVFALIAADA